MSPDQVMALVILAVLAGMVVALVLIGRDAQRDDDAPESICVEPGCERAAVVLRAARRRWIVAHGEPTDVTEWVCPRHR